MRVFICLFLWVKPIQKSHVGIMQVARVIGYYWRLAVRPVAMWAMNWVVMAMKDLTGSWPDRLIHGCRRQVSKHITNIGETCRRLVVTHSTLEMWLHWLKKSTSFYAQKQLLPSARLNHRNSVCLSVCPSVRHTDGSVKNGASYDHQIFTVGCLKDSKFRNRKAFP